jgi:wyosine [tRNA(Phe)-imidazoG37] synthetase (radical SAM superfamily)
MMMEVYVSHNENLSTVYGPVLSWRFGQSLGIDPIFQTSICSFNCVYCQLGEIQKITAERKIYVPTDKFQSDLENFLQSNTKEIDVVTFSGSGEPTLATNLGEMADILNMRLPGKDLQVLTNSTMLNDLSVQEDLKKMDRVIIKLDASDDKTLQMINRPAAGITVQSIYEGILSFKENFEGKLDVQIMFMHMNHHGLDVLSEMLTNINPDTIQLNTPKRPYPLSWNRETRGNHSQQRDYETRTLKVLSSDEAKIIEDTLRKNTGLNVLSIYRD